MNRSVLDYLTCKKICKLTQKLSTRKKKFGCTEQKPCSGKMC